MTASRSGCRILYRWPWLVLLMHKRHFCGFATSMLATVDAQSPRLPKQNDMLPYPFKTSWWHINSLCSRIPPTLLYRSAELEERSSSNMRIPRWHCTCRAYCKNHLLNESPKGSPDTRLAIVKWSLRYFEMMSSNLSFSSDSTLHFRFKPATSTLDWLAAHRAR